MSERFAEHIPDKIKEKTIQLTPKDIWNILDRYVLTEDRKQKSNQQRIPDEPQTANKPTEQALSAIEQQAESLFAESEYPYTGAALLLAHIMDRTHNLEDLTPANIKSVMAVVCNLLERTGLSLDTTKIDSLDQQRQAHTETLDTLTDALINEQVTVPTEHIWPTPEYQQQIDTFRTSLHDTLRALPNKSVVLVTGHHWRDMDAAASVQALCIGLQKYYPNIAFAPITHDTPSILDDKMNPPIPFANLGKVQRVDTDPNGNWTIRGTETADLMNQINTLGGTIGAIIILDTDANARSVVGNRKGANLDFYNAVLLPDRTVEETKPNTEGPLPIFVIDHHPQNKGQEPFPHTSVLQDPQASSAAQLVGDVLGDQASPEALILALEGIWADTRGLSFVEATQAHQRLMGVADIVSRLHGHISCLRDAVDKVQLVTPKDKQLITTLAKRQIRMGKRPETHSEDYHIPPTMITYLTPAEKSHSAMPEVLFAHRGNTLRIGLNVHRQKDGSVYITGSFRSNSRTDPFDPKTKLPTTTEYTKLAAQAGEWLFGKKNPDGQGGGAGGHGPAAGGRYDFSENENASIRETAEQVHEHLVGLFTTNAGQPTPEQQAMAHLLAMQRVGNKDNPIKEMNVLAQERKRILRILRGMQHDGTYSTQQQELLDMLTEEAYGLFAALLMQERIRQLPWEQISTKGPYGLPNATQTNAELQVRNNADTDTLNQVQQHVLVRLFGSGEGRSSQ